MIKRIVEDYKRRIENDIDVPPFLQKEIDGICMKDFDKGISLLIDGLQDEKVYINDLLEKI